MEVTFDMNEVCFSRRWSCFQGGFVEANWDAMSLEFSTADYCAGSLFVWAVFWAVFIFIFSFSCFFGFFSRMCFCFGLGLVFGLFGFEPEEYRSSILFKKKNFQ